MLEYLKNMDWLGLFLYGLFGFLLSYGGIGVLTQPLVFFGVLAILVVVDVRAHNAGLDKGVEIMEEVWGK